MVSTLNHFVSLSTTRYSEENIFKQIERSIFQTFWKPDFGARFLFIELDTSNFGYLLIF